MASCVYQDRNYLVYTVTIPSGGTQSESIDCQGYVLLGVATPSNWGSSAGVGVLVSGDNVNFYLANLTTTNGAASVSAGVFKTMADPVGNTGVLKLPWIIITSGVPFSEPIVQSTNCLMTVYLIKHLGYGA